MVSHMKATVELSDELLAESREVATREGITLRSLIEAGLREQLAQRRRRGRFRLRDASVDGDGLTAEFRDAGWHTLREAAYGGR